jgi:hypothetical protein
LDADALVRTPGLLAILRSRDDAEPADGAQAVRLAGAVVEIIEVAPISSAAASAIDDQRDRLFVASHWFAYDTGEQLTVRTQPGDADQVLRVATPPGLFATKAHALVGRPSEDKVPSDLIDLLLLAEQFDARALLAALPADLRGLVHHFLASRINDAVQRTRLLRLTRQAGLLGITDQRLRTAFAPLMR